MARVAPRVPESTDLLCERCGYVLNGLPADGRCPECGEPIADSLGENRRPTVWEALAEPGTARRPTADFVRTCLAIIARPARFYRTFATRGPLAAARAFAQWNWWIAAFLFGVAGATHSIWYWSDIGALHVPNFGPGLLAAYAGITVGLMIIVYLVLDGTTRLAARLTTLEGTYRGYRLPYEIVLRALYYHSAHYLPAAAVAVVTVVGFRLLLVVHPMSAEAAPKYLYVLCGEVVVGAVYLFQTYWIGMRNMMYANR